MGWGHRGGVSEESSLVLSPPLPGGDSVVPQARRGLTAAGSPRPRLSLTVRGLCLRQRPPLAFWGKSCFSESTSWAVPHPAAPPGSAPAGAEGISSPRLCCGQHRGGRSRRGRAFPVPQRGHLGLQGPGGQQGWAAGGPPVDSRRCPACRSDKNPKPSPVLIRPLTHSSDPLFRASSGPESRGCPGDGDGVPTDEPLLALWERKSELCKASSLEE